MNIIVDPPADNQDEDWREVLAERLRVMPAEEFRAELEAARERLAKRAARRERARVAAARLRSE